MDPGVGFHRIKFNILKYLSPKYESLLISVCPDITHEKLAFETIGVLDFDLQPPPQPWALGSDVIELTQTLQGAFSTSTNAFYSLL